MDTGNVFEQIASRYDNEDRDRVAGIIADAIRRELTGARGKSALDYGCGTGLVGLRLTDLFGSLLFADASPQMLEQVRVKLSRSGVAGADTMRLDLCEGPPPAALSFDYILLSQVLLHVRDYLTLLERLYPMLGEGGHLIIVDFDRNERVVSDRVHCGFEQAELARALRRIGFADVHSATFHRGKRLFMNQDASLFLLNAEKGAAP